MIRFNTIHQVHQDAGPAAHVKRNALVKSSGVGDIFEDIFHTARRPGEQALLGLVLAGVFVEGSHPFCSEGDLPFFVAVAGVGVAHKDIGISRVFQGEMAEVDASALAFFHGCLQQELQQGVRTGIRRF